MLITLMTGFTPPRQNTILITRRIIIRTILGTPTMAARTTTASDLRAAISASGHFRVASALQPSAVLSPPDVYCARKCYAKVTLDAESDRNVTFPLKRAEPKWCLLFTWIRKLPIQRSFASLVFSVIGMRTGRSLDTYPSWLSLERLSSSQRGQSF